MDPFLPDDEKLAALRQALPATGAGIYLDTATAGPLPAETARALTEADEWELRVGRSGLYRAADVDERAVEARAVIAAVLGGDPDAVVLTHGPADGLARLALALGAGPGSVRVDPRASPTVTAAVGPAAITRRTDAGGAGAAITVVPHVDHGTGELVTIDAAVAEARERGTVVIIDASLSIGAVPFDAPSSGADAVLIAGDRWLLGPDGIGALWVGDRLRRSVDVAALQAGGLPPRRAILGLARSVGWLAMYVGLPWAHERVAAAAAALHAALEPLPGVELATARDRLAAVVAFRIRSWPSTEAAEELSHRVFALMRADEASGLLVASVGPFTTSDEVGRFAGAVAALARHTPESLPRRPAIVMLGESGAR